ncbi:MazG-like family protein [Streptomyces sp. NPDC056304]|uniref:MazG-like family protein n=1 Tax=Streptomyces sp. NPDC056304 TaxID=3345778 RepID=UPI0035D9CC1C
MGDEECVTMDDTWSGVERLRRWLDLSPGQAAAGDVRVLRVLKISEEVGEVSEALTGVLGANPRKGESHTWQDVETELCDVIVSAMVALSTITPDAPKVLDERVQRLLKRALPSSR